jgi:hypothetical protein
MSTLIRIDGHGLIRTGVDYATVLRRWSKALAGSEVRFMRLSCEGEVLWINPRQVIYMLPEGNDG